MKRIVGSAVSRVVLLVLLLLLLAPAVTYRWDDGATAGGEETRITSYVATFDVDDQGDLDAVETLTVDFPFAGKHGIFRFFDREDPNDSHERLVPHDISVTMDGAPVPVELLTEGRGRYTDARIGDPNRTVVPGEHVYEIRYTIDGVLDPGTNGHETQFYWNLVPGGWRQAIAKTDLTVHLPVAAQDVQCAVGAGLASGCKAAGQGTETLHVRTGALAPNTPVTVKTGLDMPTPPAGTSLPWSPRFDRVFGTSLVLLVVVVVLAVLAGVTGFLLGWRTRERDPGFPLMYAPPEGIGPAQAAYLVSEDVDEQQYVATLLYAAEKGAVGLDRTDRTWTITDKSGAAGWAGLDPVTTGVAHLLGGPGTTFRASPKDVSAGKRLKSEIEDFERNVRDWAQTSGLMVRSGLGGLGGIVIGACAIAVIAIAIWNPFEMTAVGLIPGLFAVGGVRLAATGAGTRRTRTGRDLWSRAGGFRRILSTPSAEQRFDFSGRQELYTAFIPWAVAFGCADEWAEKYRVEMGTEPPVPTYFPGYYGAAAVGSAVSSMASDFRSTVHSAISSYEATQRSSSSSGGGGFSGGGGGGGGGGGSW